MTVLSALMVAVALELWGVSPRGRLGDGDRPVVHPAVRRGAIIALAVLGVIAVLVLARDYLATVIAGLLVAAVTWRVVSQQLRTRAEGRTRLQVARFLGLVTADLRSGAEIGAAVSQAAEEVSDVELATALTIAGRTTRAGRSGAQALERHARGIPQLKPLVAVWTVAEKYGISLTELLGNAQQRIDATARHGSATAASLQGAQATAGILSLLPLLGIAMGYALGVDTLGFLFGGGIGGVILVVGVGLLCAGVALSHKIIMAAM